MKNKNICVGQTQPKKEKLSVRFRKWVFQPIRKEIKQPLSKIFLFVFVLSSIVCAYLLNVFVGLALTFVCLFAAYFIIVPEKVVISSDNKKEVKNVKKKFKK